jgi:hypothetical protein
VDEDRDHDAWVAKLVQALKDGTPLDLVPFEDHVDLSQAAEWPVSRRLPGDALREALLKPDVRPDPRGLWIRAAYITGLADLANLRLAYGLHFDSCAFEQAAFWPGLTIANLHLTDCATPALTLNDACIDGRLDLRGLYAAEVRAIAATIGELALQGAILGKKGGIALSLDGAEIKGAAFLQSVNVTGAVRAFNATVGGELNFQGAIVTNEGGVALHLDGVEIRGGAFLNPVDVTGAVRALHATVGSELNLQGATLTNKKGGDALNLDGAEIKGQALLQCVCVNGAVRAFNASVSSTLNLQGATLTNKKGGDALNLQTARLGYLNLGLAAVTGTIALDAAQITVLTTPEKHMTVLIDSELSASGWHLGDVRGGIRHDRKAAAAWLSRENAAKEFVPQPWHELANVYERNGQPADARWMRRRAAQGVTRTSPWWSKPIRWLYDALTGHGYYPLRAAGWLILAIVASGIIVYTSSAVFTPTAANKAAWQAPPPAGQPAPPITGATPCQDLQDRASCLNPVLYAFDNALPGTLATGQAAQWTANGAEGPNTWIPYTLGCLKLASWILVALLLAGVTGLLRKT